MTRSSNHPDADYTPNDIGPPEHRLSYNEMVARAEFAKKLAEGRDPELEMLEERMQDYQNDLIDPL